MDNRQSYRLMSDGTSKRIVDEEAEAFNAQEYFMTNPSLSGRGESIKSSAPERIAKRLQKGS